VRLGLIARADSRGLGIQCLGVARNLNPTKVMVVDCPSAKPLPIRRDWYPDAQWVHGLPTPQDFERFCDGLSVVYTAETSYGQSFWNIAEHAGVKTVLAANYEFLDLQDRPSLWAMPSMWHFHELSACLRTPSYSRPQRLPGPTPGAAACHINGDGDDDMSGAWIYLGADCTAWD